MSKGSPYSLLVVMEMTEHTIEASKSLEDATSI